MEGRFCGQIGCIIYYKFDTSLDTFFGAGELIVGQNKESLLMMRGFERQDFLLSLDRH